MAIALVGATSAANHDSSGTGVTVNMPSGVEEGHVLLAEVRARSGIEAPSGWSVVQHITPGTDGQHAVFVRIATNSEPSSVHFPAAVDNGRTVAGIVAFSGVNNANPIHNSAASTHEATNGTTVTAPASSSTIDKCAVIRMWGAQRNSGAATISVPGSVSTLWEIAVPDSSARQCASAGYSFLVTAGSIGTLAATANVNVAHRNAITVVLEPAVSTGDPANLQVDIVGTTAHLTCDPSPTAGVDSYAWFRRTPQTGENFDPFVDEPIAVTNDPEYDDEGLAPGDYDWQVYGRIS